ncbi:MAG TPA: class II aldolase/adducin family protein [Polyangia bacterium]
MAKPESKSEASSSNQTSNLDPAELAFIEQFKRDVEKAAKVLWETRVLSPSQTFQVYQRIPGQDKYVSAPYPSIWDDGEVKLSVSGFDGTVYLGKSQGPAPGRYSRIFIKHPHITTVIHAHTNALGSWASSHRSFPIRYVPITRANVSKELPIYIDRRQAEQDFINERLVDDPHLEAVVEANGGSTFWGAGVINVVKRIILIEEGAGYQLHAEALGGSKQYGPGVLEQQWRMGLVPKDVAAAALAAYYAAGGPQGYDGESGGAVRSVTAASPSPAAKA